MGQLQMTQNAPNQSFSGDVESGGGGGGHFSWMAERWRFPGESTDPKYARSIDIAHRIAKIDGE